MSNETLHSALVAILIWELISFAIIGGMVGYFIGSRKRS